MTEHRKERILREIEAMCSIEEARFGRILVAVVAASGVLFFGLSIGLIVVGVTS